MHSEMGPVRHNPIQSTVRTAHLSVLVMVYAKNMRKWSFRKTQIQHTNKSACTMRLRHALTKITCSTCARSLLRVFNVLARIVTGRGIWFASRNFINCNGKTQQPMQTSELLGSPYALYVLILDIHFGFWQLQFMAIFYDTISQTNYLINAVLIQQKPAQWICMHTRQSYSIHTMPGEKYHALKLPKAKLTILLNLV